MDSKIKLIQQTIALCHSLPLEGSVVVGTYFLEGRFCSFALVAGVPVLKSFSESFSDSIDRLYMLIPEYVNAKSEESIKSSENIKKAIQLVMNIDTGGIKN